MARQKFSGRRQESITWHETGEGVRHMENKRSNNFINKIGMNEMGKERFE